MKKTLRTTPLACVAGLLFSTSLVQAQAPAYAWAKGMGGSGADMGVRMTTDAAGNTYTCGSYSGMADLDPGAGTFNLTAAGGTDIFVCKLDATGALVWAVSMGGTGTDAGNAIALDASGNIYITGSFQNTADFDPGAGNLDLVSAGMNDIFVCKLDAAGALLWAKGTGGVNDDAGNAIAIDGTGNVLTVGNIGAMSAIDFDPSAGTTSITSFGGTDDFIWKLDNAGNFVFVKQIGGTVSDLCNGLVLDAGGNIYLTGSFNGTTDFDPDAGTYTLSSLGSNDIFICKLDATGAFLWAVGMGSSGTDIGNYITLDNAGNVLVTGNFANTVDFNPDSGATLFLTASGLNDPFVCKFTAAGIFTWAKSFTGSGFDRGAGLTVNAANNIYANGAFAGTMDFDPGAGTFSLTSAGSNDAYVAALDASGNYLWAISIGGTGDDAAQSVKQTAGKIYVAGRFSNTADFDPTAAAADLTSSGSTDIYVAQYQPACMPTDSTITASACNSYTLNSTTYTISGTHTQTLTNAAGCDSTIILNLTINLPTDSTITTSACNSYTLNSTTYTSSGIYTQMLTNAAGCDSTITLNLTINTVDASVTSSALTITATATPATYQWLDCNAAFAPIGGETNQSYTASADGDYAVIVTQSGCSDTSMCVNITGTGITALEWMYDLDIYPNPSTGNISLVLNENGRLSITTLDGKTVWLRQISAGAHTFDLGHLPAGVYVLQLQDSGLHQVKWVKL